MSFVFVPLLSKTSYDPRPPHHIGWPVHSAYERDAPPTGLTESCVLDTSIPIADRLIVYGYLYEVYVFSYEIYKRYESSVNVLGTASEDL